MGHDAINMVKGTMGVDQLYCLLDGAWCKQVEGNLFPSAFSEPIHFRMLEHQWQLIAFKQVFTLKDHLAIEVAVLGGGGMG